MAVSLQPIPGISGGFRIVGPPGEGTPPVYATSPKKGLPGWAKLALGGILVAGGYVGAAKILQSQGKGFGCPPGENGLPGLCSPPSPSPGGGGGGCACPLNASASCPCDELCVDPSTGQCPTGTSPDSAHPGCCVNLCPATCTQNSECTACGTGVTCAMAAGASSGSCLKQVPGSLEFADPADLFFGVGVSYSYQVFYPVGNCALCNGSVKITWNQGGAFLIVRDQNGNPMRNQRVNLSSPTSAVAPANGWQWTISYKGADGGTQGPFLTDRNGAILMFIVPLGTSNDITPCPGANGTTVAAAGVVTVYATDNPGAAPAVGGVSSQMIQSSAEHEGCF